MTSPVRMFLAILVVAMLGAGLCGAQDAHAEFGPIQLVSKSASEQADEAYGPAISADGRYVAFAGVLGGRPGVFRKELKTGAVALVDALTAAEEVSRLANPSISADGRFVAFTTTAQLDPDDDTEAGTDDVYVADMDATPPTYELASAGNGSTEALSGGSVAAGQVALSEDGRRVVFTNEGEVYVRELGTTDTLLISALRDPLTGAMTAEPVPLGGAPANIPAAAISGDGSTVAWVGSHLPEQVPMLADEEAQALRLDRSVSSDDPNGGFHEPLWREVPDSQDPDPPTRRIVGGGDPLALGCPPDGTLSDPACLGPVPDLQTSDEPRDETEGYGWGLDVPRLDRDGETVALVGDPEEADADLFVIDMSPGLDRREALRHLTHWTNPNPALHIDLSKTQYFPLTAPITDCAISPDGNRIAFTTVRQVFPLAPPTLVSPPPTTATDAELYQVDFTGETIERVTPGGSAGSSLGGVSGASTPSYSADGRLLAFSSDAYNLVAGDANEGPDAFVVESPLPAPIDESAISHRPAALVVKPLWRLTVTVASLPHGEVSVTAGVPGAGTIAVKAAARLGSKRKLRRVASMHRSAAAAGVQRIELRLPRKLRGLAHQKGGLYAQLDVAFNGSGGQPLHAGLDARFLVHQKKTKRKAKR
jgi:hypothetical protein